MSGEQYDGAVVKYFLEPSGVDASEMYIGNDLLEGVGKAVMKVVKSCDGNVTKRHDVTANLSNMRVPIKTVTDVTV